MVVRREGRAIGETDRQRQTDKRQTDRDRQTDRHRQTDRQTDRESGEKA